MKWTTEINDGRNLAKPCPCCGSGSIYVQITDGQFGEMLFIKCESCGIRTKPYSMHNVEFKEAFKKDLNVWNRREGVGSV